MDTHVIKGLRRAVGVCLGASTLSIVEIESTIEGARVVNVVQEEHDGDPKNVLARHLDGYDLAGKYLGATGRKFRRILALPSITETEATEYAFAHVNSKIGCFLSYSAGCSHSTITENSAKTLFPCHLLK